MIMNGIVFFVTVLVLFLAISNNNSYKSKYLNTITLKKTLVSKLNIHTLNLFFTEKIPLSTLIHHNFSAIYSRKQSYGLLSGITFCQTIKTYIEKVIHQYTDSYIQKQPLFFSIYRY